MESNEMVNFYSDLNGESGHFAKEKAVEIKLLLRQTAQCIIEIGKNLILVKDKLDHGHWLPWLNKEFGWSDKSARNFMDVSRRFNSVDLVDLDIGKSALYLLASNSTPDSAVEEALELAESGEKITVQKAKKIIKKNKELEKNIEELRKNNMNMNRELENTHDIVKEKNDDVLDLKNQIRIAENDLSIKDSQIKMFEEENSEVKKKDDELLNKLEQNNRYLLERINALEIENAIENAIDTSHTEIEKVIEKEKLVEIVPDDYIDIKDENEELKKKIALLESRGGISQEKGISAAVNEIEGVFEFLDENFDLKLIEPDDKDKLRKVLLKIYPYLNDTNYEMPAFKTSDRLKLKHAGYTLLRLHNKKINELSDKGGWIMHSKYETKKEADESYKQLLESEKCISA
ncbi:MAG: DUF3102 domain-containing protein [Desulfobacterales bacterium]|nr:DUF3102 domain-containing protein [Desulfobacterales bacterium]